MVYRLIQRCACCAESLAVDLDKTDDVTEMAAIFSSPQVQLGHLILPSELPGEKLLHLLEAFSAVQKDVILAVVSLKVHGPDPSQLSGYVAHRLRVLIAVLMLVVIRLLVSMCHGHGVLHLGPVLRAQNEVPFPSASKAYTKAAAPGLHPS